MSNFKQLERSISWWITVWLATAALVLGGAGLWCLMQLRDSAPAAASLLWEMKQILGLSLAAGLLLAGFGLRLCLGAAVRRCASQETVSTSKPLKKTRPEPAPQTALVQEETLQARAMNERRALQLVSILQREGRLVDFLNEDLAPYDDAQIGAAVRSIQEGCKKVLRKHIAPAPVMDGEEGAQVTIAADFDPAAVKLTGNVTGRPPFSGVLQHRGWRAGRLDLPALSGAQDPRIIAPAEVEIP